MLQIGYQQTEFPSKVKVKISLIILKEMMQEGYIINRHIDTLYKENAIESLNDLEIKDLIFELDERK